MRQTGRDPVDLEPLVPPFDLAIRRRARRRRMIAEKGAAAIIEDCRLGG
jgi:hypothetical protein